MIRRTLNLGRVLRLFPVLLLLAATARAEDPDSVKLSGESPAAKLRLAEARKRIDNGKWSEAIEELQTVLNTYGSDLVSISPTYSIQSGRLCRIQLASLPPEALRLYRQRYENQARKKLEQAQSEHDIPQLRKLVEDSFCSRAAEKAIDLLGDLAFERGQFEEAEEWWRLLSPLPDARRDLVTRGFALRYPDTSFDPAFVQAKQLLARFFRGADNDWVAELGAFRQRHAKAEGTLGGRKGRYVDLLQALAAERKKQGDSNREEWPTFGGDPSRGHSIPAPEDILDRLSALCGDGPTWSFNLEQRTLQQEARPVPAVSAAQARTLAFHPVILGHRVLVADARYVTAIDMRNGKSEQWYDVAEKNGGVNPNLHLPAPPDLRYTLTVADDNAYVRLGAQDIGVETPAAPVQFGMARPRRDNETFLACLSLRPGEGSGHFRWRIRGIAHDGAFLEGAPLAAGGLIWIASIRYQNSDCITGIDCFTANDSAEPPLRWRTDVCKTSQTKAGEPHYRHQLLTLAGTQIVYCTHTGVVFAVDALTGRRNWAMRYPKRTLDTEEVDLRDLSPVLFADGRLYVAPADSDTLLCLDPATGRILWELEPQRVVHLLGVGQGRLIFTTPKGLQAVRADDGSPAWAVPDAGGALTPSGRGLLIGDLVLFPTTQPRDPGSPFMEAVVYAIRQRDGRPADDPAKLHRLPAGNLAYANGCLVVADQQTLSIFVPPRLLLAKRKAEAQRHPDSAAVLMELARAESDAGQNENALRTLQGAESKTPNLPTSRRKRMLERLHSEQQHLLLESARNAAVAKRWNDVETALQQAFAVPLPPRGRLHTLLRAAQIWKDAGDTDRARTVWEAILADERLRQIQVINKNGKPMSAAENAAKYFEAGERGVSTPRPQYTWALTRPARQRLQAPSLPLLRKWHARLGSDQWILAGWLECDSELLIGSHSGRLTCRLASTGEVRWQSRLPFAPRWAGCHGDTVLAAGEEGVACLRRDNGQVIWHFPAPVAGRCPRSFCDDVCVIVDSQPPKPLSAFQLISGRFFFLQGQRRLFALSAETGAVLWNRWAPDGELCLPYPRGCFSAYYYAGAETVLIHSSGRRWLLDAATGRQIHQAADSRDLWQRAPLEMDERTLCVVSDTRHVLLLNSRTGQCLWEHQSNAGTSLSGELPTVLGRGDLLFYVQPANIGYLLHRIDRETGKSVWPRPQLLEANTVDVSAWTFDPDAVFSFEDRFLIARSLTDGTVLWRQPLLNVGPLSLPCDAWQARRVGDYLAVSPQVSVSARFRFRSPLGPLQWDLSSLAAPETIFPLSFYDPKTGQLVQRLNLRIESPLRTTSAMRGFQEDGGRMRIVRTSSILASEDGPVIRLDTPCPFVAVGGEIWGLTSKSNFTTEKAVSAERKD